MIPKGERDELIRVAKLRARLSKSNVAQREAEMLADFEQQLAAEFSPNEEGWREARVLASKAIDALNQQIHEVCDQLGVRPEFRPRASIYWSTRGENIDKNRRTELRKVAQTRIAAAGLAAKNAISATEADVITELIAGGLESEEAKRFLATMPTPAQLMPALNLAEIEAEATR